MKQVNTVLLIGVRNVKNSFPKPTLILRHRTKICFYEDKFKI